MPWLILALMGAAAFLYGVSIELPMLCLLTKPVPVLVLLGWLHDAPVTEYRRWIGLGLIFSLLGDVLLAWPGDLFVFGLGAFLVAHLAYLKAYLGDLLIPVTVYALAISAMLWRALARLGTDVPKRSALLAAAGALTFAFSDSLIGIDRFVVKFAAAPYLIIIAYWLGQWGIAASAFSQKPN